VSLAQLFMDGPTIMFFRALSEDDEYHTWEKLKDALCEKYGGLREAKVYEQLSVLQQDGSVEFIHQRVRAFSHSGASFTGSAVRLVLCPWSPRKG